LRWLAAGATEEEILGDYPYLDKQDFLAVFAYALNFQIREARRCEVARSDQAILVLRA
jgi:uncharacterized protein (DUF433 family)